MRLLRNGRLVGQYSTCKSLCTSAIGHKHTRTHTVEAAEKSMAVQIVDTWHGVGGGGL